MRINKKRIAKEWLIFLALIFGMAFIFWPLFFYFFGAGTVKEYFTSRLWKLDFETFFILFIGGPYLLLALIRSIIWAIKMVKINNSASTEKID